MLAVLLFLVACRPDGETGDSDTGTPIDRTDAIEAIRQQATWDLRRAAGSGAQVAVWLDGEIVFSEGFGTADPDTDAPVVPTTLFQFGSDLKKLTAIGLLQQVDAGHLRLDDTLADAIPDLEFAQDPTWNDAITLHDLLSHQSGLFDYTPWTHDPDDAALAGRATGRFAEHAYAMAPPGRFWNYANPNFSLAGLVTERAAGRPWADVVEQDVFAPLGMIHTHARLSTVAALGGYAVGTGYSADDLDRFDVLDDETVYTFGRIDMADQVDNAFTRPAGLVWSTAEDQVRLAAFLVDGDPAVLSDGLVAGITTPQVPMYPAYPATALGYGHGVMVAHGWWAGDDRYYATPIWQHGGNTLSMTSAFFVLPEQRLAVSILSNGYGDDFTRTAVAVMEGLGDLPAPVEAPDLLQPAPEDLSVYAGTYVDPYGVGTVTVTLADGRLRIEAPDLAADGHTVGTALTVVALDLMVARIDGYDFELAVYRDASGAPTWLAHRQFVLTRGAAPAAAAAPRPTRLSRPPTRAPVLGPRIPRP